MKNLRARLSGALKALEVRLVDDWRHAWKWGSVQLALAYGAIQSWAAADPDGFQRAMAMLPPDAQRYVGIALAFAAIATRLSSVRRKADG